MLRRCRASVSQAGYNTILDILTAGARAVVVPFAAERETEQQLRAERLTACGVLELVPEAQLTAVEFARAVERATKRDRRMISVEMNGACRSARLIANIIREPSSVTGRTHGILWRG
jgi:predicted glycosyltransferase